MTTDLRAELVHKISYILNWRRKEEEKERKKKLFQGADHLERQTKSVDGLEKRKKSFLTSFDWFGLQNETKLII